MDQPRYQTYSCHDTWSDRLLRGLCSSLVPGAGQLLAGSRVRAYIMLGLGVPILLAFVLVGMLWVEQGDDLLASIFDPTLLKALLAVNIVLLLFRLYAVGDAMIAGRIRWNAVGRAGQPAGHSAAGKASSKGGWWKPALIGLALVLVLGSTVAAQVWFGYGYLYKAYSTIEAVFETDDTTTSTLAPTTTLAGGGPITTEDPALTTTTVPAVSAWAGDDGILSILFSGSDAGVGRSGGRADTNMVACFNLETGRIALFSIPRNTGNAPLSEEAQKVMGMKYYSNWITGLYGTAQRYPQLAPEGDDPGAVVMRDTISIIMGIEIDYYAVLDMLGFVDLVDMMGGVEVYFDKDLHMSISPPTEEESTLVYDFDEGVHRLDGRQALAFARTRKDSSDYVRMGRQRCVIAALLDQTGVSEMMWNFPGIMDVMKRSVKTDIPFEAMQELIRLRSKLKTDEMITIGFIPPKYTNGLNGNTQQSGWILDYKLIRETVKLALEHPEEILAERDDAGLDTGDCWKKPQEE